MKTKMKKLLAVAVAIVVLGEASGMESTPSPLLDTPHRFLAAMFFGNGGGSVTVRIPDLSPVCEWYANRLYMVDRPARARQPDEQPEVAEDSSIGDMFRNLDALGITDEMSLDNRVLDVRVMPYLRRLQPRFCSTTYPAMAFFPASIVAISPHSGVVQPYIGGPTFLDLSHMLEMTHFQCVPPALSNNLRKVIFPAKLEYVTDILEWFTREDCHLDFSLCRDCTIPCFDRDANESFTIKGIIEAVLGDHTMRFVLGSGQRISLASHRVKDSDMSPLLSRVWSVTRTAAARSTMDRRGSNGLEQTSK
jgi:hypothetical protein